MLRKPNKGAETQSPKACPAQDYEAFKAQTLLAQGKVYHGHGLETPAARGYFGHG